MRASSWVVTLSNDVNAEVVQVGTWIIQVVGVRAVPVLLLAWRIRANLEEAHVIIIIVPDFVASVVETHLDGRKVRDNVICVRYSVVVGELAPEIVGEILISNSWRAKSIEIELVGRLDLLFDI